MDDKSKHDQNANLETTLAPENATVESKGLEGTGIAPEREPLQPCCESVIDELTENLTPHESIDEPDHTEPFPGSRGMTVKIHRTTTSPTSDEARSVDPIESIQTNHQDTAPATNNKGMGQLLPEVESSLYGSCLDLDLNLRPCIDVWCVGHSGMVQEAVDAIWHNYYEKVALECVKRIHRVASDDLEGLQNSIRRSQTLLSTTRDSGDKGVTAGVKTLRKDLAVMSLTLEHLSKGRPVKYYDMRSPNSHGKRVWLDKKLPFFRIRTGEGCEVCGSSRRTR